MRTKVCRRCGSGGTGPRGKGLISDGDGRWLCPACHRQGNDDLWATLNSLPPVEAPTQVERPAEMPSQPEPVPAERPAMSDIIPMAAIVRIAERVVAGELPPDRGAVIIGGGQTTFNILLHMLEGELSPYDAAEEISLGCESRFY